MYTFLKRNRILEKNENNIISSKQKRAVSVVAKLLSAMHKEIKELNDLKDLENNLEMIIKGFLSSNMQRSLVIVGSLKTKFAK